MHSERAGKKNVHLGCNTQSEGPSLLCALGGANESRTVSGVDTLPRSLIQGSSMDTEIG